MSNTLHPVPYIYPRHRVPLPKEPEKNLVSGVVSIVVLVLACASLSQPEWFWLDGGGCNVHVLGLYLFLHPGYFQFSAEDSHRSIHTLYITDNQELKCCITEEILNLIRFIICLIFVIIASTIIQMIFDIIGTQKQILQFVRKHSFASIFAVLMCVASIGLCYYVTVLMEAQQQATKPMEGHAANIRVRVKLTLGFYLLLSAGGMSVIAVGCNWLRPLHIFHQSDSTPLMNDWDGLEGLETFSSRSGAGGFACPSLSYLHNQEPPPPVEGYPPPPYTP